MWVYPIQVTFQNSVGLYYVRVFLQYANLTPSLTLTPSPGSENSQTHALNTSGISDGEARTRFVASSRGGGTCGPSPV